MKKVFILAMCSTILVGCGSKVDEAYELKELGLKDKAIEFLTKLTSDDPKNADAYFALGNVYAEVGKTQEAFEQYGNALKLKPDNDLYQSRVLLLQALQSSYSNDFEEKVQALIKSGKNTKVAHVLLANLYSRNASYDKALAKKYFDVIKKLNDLMALSDWQTIYSDPATKKISAIKFFVVSDSTEYFDKSNKSVGFLKKGENITIDKAENDSIYFTDPRAYRIDTRFAWRISKVIKLYRNYSGGYLYVDDATNSVQNPYVLYTQPKCTFFNYNYMSIPKVENVLNLVEIYEVAPIVI